MTREELIDVEAFRYKLVAHGEFHSTVKAFKAGAHWADIHPQSPWINTKDRLPLLQGRYFVHLKCGDVSTAGLTKVCGEICWDVDINRHRYMDLNEVDFWMPIPELPKGGRE